MRSVVVVFPASMCAMIPMFRTFSIATGRSAIFNAKLISRQYRKWLNALLLSAIRWVSSFRFTAPPVF